MGNAPPNPIDAFCKRVEELAACKNSRLTVPGE